ncbi:alpha/beta hydrolase [Diaminobutyricimonas sp. TR449]|uniref:alpha/beta fold hydrolase n=1 Tax=Diaminobutyricimonas sp. TR449 TaxID=2708076 RepID=UPI0014247637|nr:alpha/beta hydrolase [Diaminobutyricimonas sp. TR449]
MSASYGNEFGPLAEVAAELGLSAEHLPPVRRIDIDCDGQRVSAIAWGPGAPDVVFLHGGSQNAHTWDLLSVELRMNALAIDLPGHGQSDWRADHDYSPSQNALAIARVLDEVAPDAQLVVGMSFGGLSLIALAATRPDLVRRALLVDILPELPAGRSHRDRDRLVELRRRSAERYRSRDEMVNQAIAVARRRTRASLARGVFHNSVQDPDGWWRWRYDPGRMSSERSPDGNERLWHGMVTLPPGTKLVRGALSTFVGEDSLARLREAARHVDVETVADAGHAVQSDQPRALATIVREMLEPKAE